MPGLKQTMTLDISLERRLCHRTLPGNLPLPLHRPGVLIAYSMSYRKNLQIRMRFIDIIYREYALKSATYERMGSPHHEFLYELVFAMSQ